MQVCLDSPVLDKVELSDVSNSQLLKRVRGVSSVVKRLEFASKSGLSAGKENVSRVVKQKPKVSSVPLRRFTQLPLSVSRVKVESPVVNFLSHEFPWSSACKPLGVFEFCGVRKVFNTVADVDKYLSSINRVGDRVSLSGCVTHVNLGVFNFMDGDGNSVERIFKDLMYLIHELVPLKVGCLTIHVMGFDSVALAGIYAWSVLPCWVKLKLYCLPLFGVGEDGLPLFLDKAHSVRFRSQLAVSKGHCYGSTPVVKVVGALKKAMCDLYDPSVNVVSTSSSKVVADLSRSFYTNCNAFFCCVRPGMSLVELKGLCSATALCDSCFNGVRRFAVCRDSDKLVVFQRLGGAYGYMTLFDL